MSTSQSHGIQQLLAAEKRAAEKKSDRNLKLQIDTARKRRHERLKQAKREAQEEIEYFAKKREDAFRKREAVLLAQKEAALAEALKEAEALLIAIDERVAANRQAVVDRLLGLVCDIRPQLHHNIIRQREVLGFEKDDGRDANSSA